MIRRRGARLQAAPAPGWSTMEANLASIDQIKRTAIDLGMNFGPRLVVAVLILAAGYFAGRWVGRVFGRGLARIELEPPVRLLLQIYEDESALRDIYLPCHAS